MKFDVLSPLGIGSVSTRHKMPHETAVVKIPTCSLYDFHSLYCQKNVHKLQRLRGCTTTETVPEGYGDCATDERSEHTRCLPERRRV